MHKTLLTPCPNCGKDFSFPGTGCITFVSDFLLASTEGKCPNCGTQVVIDAPESQPRIPVNPLELTQTDEDAQAVKIVDLDLSIRSRLTLTRMGIDTIGDLLQRKTDDLRAALNDVPSCFDEVNELLERKGLKFRGAV